MKSGKSNPTAQPQSKNPNLLQVPSNTARGREHQAQPLTREFFNELIKLETRISNKDYTLETLDELTQYYAKAVEYYDGIKDNIAHYFLYKIQDTLATKKSLRILMDEAAKNANKQTASANEDPAEEIPRDRSKTEMPMSSPTKEGKRKSKFDRLETEDSGSDIEDNELEKKRKEYLAQRGKGGRDSITQLRVRKARFATYFVKVEQHKQIEKQNLLTVISEYDNKSQNNDKLVKNNIDDQKNRLKKRLEDKSTTEMNSFINSTQQFNSTMWLDELAETADDTKSMKSGMDFDFLRSPKEFNFNTPSTKPESDMKHQTFSKMSEPFTKESEHQSEASLNLSPIIIKPNLMSSAEGESVLSHGDENGDRMGGNPAIKIFSAEKSEGEFQVVENKEDGNSDSNDSELKLEVGKDIVIENQTNDKVDSASFDDVTEENTDKIKSEEENTQQQNEEGVLVNS